MVDVREDSLHRDIRLEFARVDDDIGVIGRFIRVANAGELLDLTAARLGVEALAVTRLAYLERGRDVHQHEVRGPSMARIAVRPCCGLGIVAALVFKVI